MNVARVTALTVRVACQGTEPLDLSASDGHHCRESSKTATYPMDYIRQARGDAGGAEDWGKPAGDRKGGTPSSDNGKRQE